MPDINDAFPSRFVKAHDLRGNRVIVTIDRVEYEVISQEKKAVLYFRNKEKSLVLNKTNANSLIRILGSAITEDWRGRQVVLYPAMVQYKSDMVPAIRIDAAAGQPSVPRPEPIPAYVPAAPPSHPPQDEWQPDPQQVSAPVYEDEVPF